MIVYKRLWATCGRWERYSVGKLLTASSYSVWKLISRNMTDHWAILAIVFAEHFVVNNVVWAQSDWTSKLAVRPTGKYRNTALPTRMLELLLLWGEHNIEFSHTKYSTSILKTTTYIGCISLVHGNTWSWSWTVICKFSKLKFI